MNGFIRTLLRAEQGKPVSVYPYDFNTSGFARVDEVRFLIEDQSEWDYAFSSADLERNNLSAAGRFGFGPNFTPEEIALRDVLIDLKAGSHIMTYAWGMYRDIINSESKTH